VQRIKMETKFGKPILGALYVQTFPTGSVNNDYWICFLNQKITHLVSTHTEKENVIVVLFV